MFAAAADSCPHLPPTNGASSGPTLNPEPGHVTRRANFKTASHTTPTVYIECHIGAGNRGGTIRQYPARTIQTSAVLTSGRGILSTSRREISNPNSIIHNAHSVHSWLRCSSAVAAAAGAAPRTEANVTCGQRVPVEVNPPSRALSVVNNASPFVGHEWGTTAEANHCDIPGRFVPPEIALQPECSHVHLATFAYRFLPSRIQQTFHRSLQTRGAWPGPAPAEANVFAGNLPNHPLPRPCSGFCAGSSSRGECFQRWLGQGSLRPYK